jgi:urease accessory protein
VVMANNELEVCSSSRISRVTKMRASYPYKFLKSSLSDNIFASVYILGFGGGAVSGDSQEMTINVQDNAILLLRTQGSTKIFKSIDGKYSSQKLIVNLSSRSLLAFLPDPTVCFKGSRYIQQQTYNLEESAR